MTGAYLPILLESAWKASIVPLGNDPTFFAMKAFGGYNMPLAFVLAVIGASAGQLFNWWMGTILLKLKNRDILKVPDDGYAFAANLFNRYGIFLLFFSWVSLLNLLVVGAGFVGTKPKVVLTLVLAGEIFNYGHVIL